LVPFAMAYEMNEKFPPLVCPTYVARVSITCRFSLVKPNPVLLTHVIGKGYEFTAMAEAGNASTKLISDTKIIYDPETRSVGVSCGLVVNANGFEGPKVVIAIPTLDATGMPVLRAEIKYPELKGKIGGVAYIAVGVKFTVDIYPRPPLLQPIPIRMPAPQQVAAPHRGFDFNQFINSTFDPTVKVAGVVLIGGIAVWLFVPMAAAGLAVPSLTIT